MKAQMQENNSEIESLKRKDQENLFIKKERNDLITENALLKSQLQNPEAINQENNTGPFGVAPNANIDMNEVDLASKMFESEKKKLIEQRALAEENCIKVLILL
jgi:hypothetical protein